MWREPSCSNMVDRNSSQDGSVTSKSPVLFAILKLMCSDDDRQRLATVDPMSMTQVIIPLPVSSLRNSLNSPKPGVSPLSSALASFSAPNPSVLDHQETT